ncbi:MAG: UDP-N-acetylglucosamine 1-carboxyvinyltransferase [Gemmatimonadetes bacterium]|jgi:UDP-N-acetylglucosamine 1-carboxyvinyltransferase|nr:UDP-N-acetylglucosamine 1-carboxyvinyltransferase [Gemmatimonadota bacterium]MDE0962965.1 UDP-N-acetylglucosamine 1-carboxyvinyltransferase [Candidatus Latescibacterota bacterium]MBT5330008.1 UDP-N-acetylglucosamine 1-carboxyvinyltransferase [Gemmatimonadota bacterium]MBT5447754.1 UDP-N-acetylglucosamine 1-carboxyvinyltransferase [Gemmatimonadota bacterium]MBT5804895.1 UDP-N-acetylglucosamine 1-carboxyvinyltransferase [Gemmatimonadota bacterium]
METLIVDGPTPLKGEIEVAGAKNSMSKLLTASMLTAEPCEFTNVPAIGDTEITKAICEALGAHCSEIGPKALLVETPDMPVAAVPEALAVQNRLSVMMLAPLVHRHGRAVVPAAGGDRIGPRPVDFHLEGYRMMGARVETLDDVYYVEADRLHGADITLPYPSVTATENLLMAATLARGRTFIRNAAIEPEVVDLALFLQKMGAIIDYHVDRTFIVEGVDSLKGTRHAIMPDRLVAASLGAAAVATGGDLFVRGAHQGDLLTFLNALRRVGGGFEVQGDGIRFFRQGPLHSIALETTVHPGFMTDWQPPFAVLLTQAEGMSVIHETVFEDRFVYISELQKMGADIEIYDTCLGGGDCRFGAMGHSHSAVIKGPTALRGAEISVPDLRAGFTYLIAAVCAEGRSVIRGVEELDRGYEDIDKSLRELGAQIERKQD